MSETFCRPSLQAQILMTGLHGTVAQFRADDKNVGPELTQRSCNASGLPGKGGEGVRGTMVSVSRTVVIMPVLSLCGLHAELDINW